MGGAHPAARAAGTAQGHGAAGLARVLAAAVYDGLLCLAVLFVVTAVAVALNGGEAIPPGTLLYELLLVVSPFPYFAWCWTRGGHTLGMRAWRLRVVRIDGETLRLRHAALRYAGALVSWAALGLGFLWMLAPPHLSWHDRLSGTRLRRTD